MGGTGVHRGQGVGDGAAGVVLGVDAQARAGVREDGPDDGGDLRREHAAVGVAEHHDIGAGLARGADDRLGVDRVQRIAVEEVLAVEEDPAALGTEVGDGVPDHREVLLRRGPQRQFHMCGVGLGDQRDDRCPGVQERGDLRIVLDPDARLAGGAERDELRVPEVDLLTGPLEELGVPRVGAGPAALDEAHPEVVEVPGDGQLVGDGEVDALALRTVAERGVEDMEVVGHRVGGRRVGVGCVRHAGLAPVGISVYRNNRFHRPSMFPRAPPPVRCGPETKKPLAGARGLRAGLGRRWPRRTRFVRGGHCGPARLLPIIMANESTGGSLAHDHPPCSNRLRMRARVPRCPRPRRPCRPGADRWCGSRASSRRRSARPRRTRRRTSSSRIRCRRP